MGKYSMDSDIDLWLSILLDQDSELTELFPRQSSSRQKGNEVYTAIGSISEKKVAIIAHDNRINDGYITSLGIEKMSKLLDVAIDSGLPVVTLFNSPGADVKEGFFAGEGFARIVRRISYMSGQVPQIGALMGPTIGGSAYMASLQDILVFERRRSSLMVSGPTVVKKVLGEDATLSTLGGAEVHAVKTGLAHFVEKNVEAQLRRVRTLIEFFPSNNQNDPDIYSVRPSTFNFPELPADYKKSYDMHEVIRALTDISTFIEYGKMYGISAVTGWARIGGYPVGIVANQPLYNAGSVSAEASEKSARFIEICDSYRVPIITLIDSPGVMPGKKEEHSGQLKSAARLCRAMQTQVPRIGVILRKNYGLAAAILSQSRGWGGDYNIALKEARIAVMGYDAAQEVIFMNKALDAIEDERMRQEFYNQYENPELYIENGLLDHIIDRVELRNFLIKKLEILKLKRYSSKPTVRGINP